MQLATRIEGGGTPRPDNWGIDSEYGRLCDLLVGPIDNYSWRAERSERLGRRFDKVAAPFTVCARPCGGTMYDGQIAN